MRIVINAKAAACAEPFAGEAAAAVPLASFIAAEAEISRWPGYAATAMHSLPGLGASPVARRQLGLGARSRILLIGTEGATDPEIYARLVGRAPVTAT